MCGVRFKACPCYPKRWGALFSGHEVNPLWWGLYNWARESDTASRLAEVSVVFEIITMCRLLRRI